MSPVFSLGLAFRRQPSASTPSAALPATPDDREAVSDANLIKTIDVTIDVACGREWQNAAWY